jgi:hypothetical protein
MGKFLFIGLGVTLSLSLNAAAVYLMTLPVQWLGSSLLGWTVAAVAMPLILSVRIGAGIVARAIIGGVLLAAGK